MIKIQPIHSTNVSKMYLNTPSRYILNYTIQFQYVLGKGNFSNVYRCWNNNQPYQYLAVKLISVGALRQQKIQHLVKAQIQILRASRHDNVIRCKDVYWNQSWCYIFTDYFQGGNLQNHLNKTPQKQTPTTLTLIKNIFQGLLYLQKQRIIHRDIKPANIFLKNKKAIVADLGFAKYYHQGFYDLHIGSPPYMAPQSLTKAYYCAKSDVWAFGVLLFQIFHGQGPFVKSLDMNQLIRNVCTPLNLMSLRLDLSIQMKQLILSCLEIDIQKRPKFSQIQDSWYFKKLFKQQDPTFPTIAHSPTTLRTPTRKMRQKQNIPIKQITCSALLDKKTEIKSPSFNRLNQLKSQIKRRKDNNPAFSSFTLLDNVGTPQKLTLFKDEVARIQRQEQELSYFRSSRTVKTEQNQEEEIDAKSIDCPELLFESQKMQTSNMKPIKLNSMLRSKSSRNFTSSTLSIKQMRIDEQKEQGRSSPWMKKSQNELSYPNVMPKSNVYINQTIYSYRATTPNNN